MWAKEIRVQAKAKALLRAAGVDPLRSDGPVIAFDLDSTLAERLEPFDESVIDDSRDGYQPAIDYVAT